MSRKTDAKDATGITTKVRDIKLPPYENNEFNPVRRTLADMLSSNESTVHNGTIMLQHAFPKFLKVTGRTINLVPQLMRMRKFHERKKSPNEDNVNELTCGINFQQDGLTTILRRKTIIICTGTLVFIYLQTRTVALDKNGGS